MRSSIASNNSYPRSVSRTSNEPMSSVSSKTHSDHTSGSTNSKNKSGTSRPPLAPRSVASAHSSNKEINKTDLSLAIVSLAMAKKKSAYQFKTQSKPKRTNPMHLIDIAFECRINNLDWYADSSHLNALPSLAPLDFNEIGKLRDPDSERLPSRKPALGNQPQSRTPRCFSPSQPGLPPRSPRIVSKAVTTNNAADQGRNAGTARSTSIEES